MQKSSFFKSYSFKALDFLFLLIFIAILVFSILNLKKSGGQTPTVIITSPDGQYIYPLDKDRDIQVKGLIGISIIHIKDGKASFKDSPCPNKTCVACTPISGNFEWIACLPNQVFVRIERNDDAETDEADVSTF